MANIEISFVIEDKEVKIKREQITSKYLQQYMELSSSITLPSKYSPVIQNYLDYLNGNPTTIDEINTFLLCLDLESFLDDDGYFQFLLKCLFDNWSTLNDVVYHNDNEAIQHEILVHIPYQLLPRHVKENSNFYKSWLPHNINTDKILDGKRYQVTVLKRHSNDQVKILRSLHVVNNGGNDVSFRLYFDKNGILTDVGEYVGKRIKNGLHQKYAEIIHPTIDLDAVILREFYKDFQLHGPRREWYSNGELFTEFEYKDGKQVGSSKRWSYRGNLTLEAEYEDGKLIGSYKEWDDNYYTPGYNLVTYGNYVNGKKDGPWIEFSPFENIDVGITERGQYQNGKKVGFWIEYRTWNYDDDRIFRGHYNNEGKRHGVWETLDDNNKVCLKEHYDNNVVIHTEHMDE